jgi:hypothetical protein
MGAVCKLNFYSYPVVLKKVYKLFVAATVHFISLILPSTLIRQHAYGYNVFTQSPQILILGVEYNMPLVRNHLITQAML